MEWLYSALDLQVADPLHEEEGHLPLCAAWPGGAEIAEMTALRLQSRTEKDIGRQKHGFRWLTTEIGTADFLHALSVEMVSSALATKAFGGGHKVFSIRAFSKLFLGLCCKTAMYT